ncbi:MAG: HEAT repeat domain-containing protein [Armatimonadetes bacterium]|nr:HEAT repeat domain-containing protein [Armatimonadota bacterium]
MNKHQKAAHRVGERKTSATEIEELLAMSCSADPEERLTAAEHLCPCHVRRRIETVWDALFRMMRDPDPRVRMASWHTLEDGGRPGDPGTLDTLEQILRAEADPKVRRFAQRILGNSLQQRRTQERALLNLPGRAASPRRGKCDFCGRSGVPVEFAPETPIPDGGGTRPALICASCAAP